MIPNCLYRKLSNDVDTQWRKRNITPHGFHIFIVYNDRLMGLTASMNVLHYQLLQDEKPRNDCINVLED